MTYSDKDNILFAPALAKCSAQKRNIAQASKRQIGGALTNRLLDVLKTLLRFSKYFSSNTFSKL